MATTYYKIASVSVGSGGSSSISFTSIPQTYTDLKLVFSSRVNYTGNWVGVLGQFNSSSSGYSYKRLYEYSSNTIATDSAATFGMSCGTSNTANTFASSELYIPNYTSSSSKSFSVEGMSENNSSQTLLLLASGAWANSAAITSISLTSDVSQNFVEYSTATLYGIKKS